MISFPRMRITYIIHPANIPFWISTEPHPFFLLVSCQRWLLCLANHYFTLFILHMLCVTKTIWHQSLVTISSNSFHVTHALSSLSFYLSPFPFSLSMHCSPLFYSSSSMKRQSWNSTWSRSRSSKLTSLWKRSRKWRMKQSQNSLPWNRYVYNGRAKRF